MQDIKKQLKEIIPHNKGGYDHVDGCPKWEFIGGIGEVPGGRYVLHEDIECDCGVDEQIAQLLALFTQSVDNDIIGNDEPSWEPGMGIGGQDLDRECRNEFRAKLRARLDTLIKQ